MPDAYGTSVSGQRSQNPFTTTVAGTSTTVRLVIQHEVSTVDINNDGAVDIVAHMGNYDGTTSGSTTKSSNNTYLGIMQNNIGVSSSASLGEQYDFTAYAGIFRPSGGYDYGYLLQSMVWADFNGDGYLDLYIGSGFAKGSTTQTGSDEGRIYLNDGQGGLKVSTDEVQWFGDNLQAGASLALDWNHDGKMDVIKVPTSSVNGAAILYQNNGDGVWGNGLALGSSGNYTGAVAVDYDWDGAVDLLMYKGTDSAGVATGVSFIRNTNAVADGTSLHVKIVDGEGIDSFYGNTINLYDSKGNLVSTQQINPQSSGTSNSSSIVNFYGLDPNETYSVQMLRIVDGVVSHVGDGHNYGNYEEGTINSTWGGLTAGKANESYVLTAEANGESYTTIGNGITGTGYNDTFFAAEGDRTYNGGGGWETNVAGSQVWKEDGGLDVVDYSSSTGAITADLSTGKATGFGNHTLNNIEGLVGSQYDDVFTDSAANNTFEGGAGNDTFNLIHGGNDTLMYKVLVDADGTGGNGSDTVNGFTIGNILTDANADIINIKDLLNYEGNVSFYNDDGEKKLDYNSKEILDYIKVESNGVDTVISIDRDGSGTEHDFTCTSSDLM